MAVQITLTVHTKEIVLTKRKFIFFRRIMDSTDIITVDFVYMDTFLRSMALEIWYYEGRIW